MAAPQQQVPQLRNIFRRRDVLNELSDAELIKRYRLDRHGIIFVTNLVRDALTSDTKRRNPLTPEMKVIITLRYLATGKMQMCSSDDLGPSQPSISRVITQTIDALADINIPKQLIKFPTTQDVADANTLLLPFSQKPLLFPTLTLFSSPALIIKFIYHSLKLPFTLCKQHSGRDEGTPGFWVGDVT